MNILFLLLCSPELARNQVRILIFQNWSIRYSVDEMCCSQILCNNYWHLFKKCSSLKWSTLLCTSPVKICWWLAILLSTACIVNYLLLSSTGCYWDTAPSRQGDLLFRVLLLLWCQLLQSIFTGRKFLCIVFTAYSSVIARLLQLLLVTQEWSKRQVIDWRWQNCWLPAHLTGLNVYPCILEGGDCSLDFLLYCKVLMTSPTPSKRIILRYSCIIYFEGM